MNPPSDAALARQGQRPPALALPLAEQWRSAGLRRGDTLLLHSNALRASAALAQAGVPRAQIADTILASVLDVLGPEGTLLMPLFNFGFCQGQPFDIRHTPSKMGALTEAARRHPAAVRTSHPVYSFAAIGHAAPRCAGLDNISGYGADSPFGLLRALDGRIGVLDLSDQESMTFVHHVEEMCLAPWRHHKHFEGNCTDAQGRTRRERYSLYVRDLGRGVLTHVDPLGERLWQQGLYQGHRPMTGSGLRLVSARAMFTLTADLIQSGQAEGLLYLITAPETC